MSEPVQPPPRLEPRPDELVAEVFGGEAHYRLEFGRNAQDAYALEFTPLAPGTISTLTRDEASRILPSGSRWRHALGWHSYFGLLTRTSADLWLAVGVERIVGHATRGAFPVLLAYFFPLRAFDFRLLQRLCARLRAAPGGDVPLPLRQQAEGVFEAPSASAAEHRGVELYILENAAAYYQYRERLAFRTLLLTDEQAQDFLARPGSAHPRRLEFDAVLASSVPALEAHFSPGVRRRLARARWKARWLPPLA